MNGSHTTGQPSWTPNRSRRTARSASAVTGVIRSTMQFGKLTFASIQSASSGFFSRAKAPIIRWATSPFPWMLSQDMTTNGSVPEARRSASASVMKPNAVPGTAPSSRSAWIAGSLGSNSPVTWLTW